LSEDATFNSAPDLSVVLETIMTLEMSLTSNTSGEYRTKKKTVKTDAAAVKDQEEAMWEPDGSFVCLFTAE
jgi:hypothetical protein